VSDSSDVPILLGGYGPLIVRREIWMTGRLNGLLDGISKGRDSSNVDDSTFILSYVVSAQADLKSTDIEQDFMYDGPIQ